MVAFPAMGLLAIVALGLAGALGGPANSDIQRWVGVGAAPVVFLLVVRLGDNLLIRGRIPGRLVLSAAVVAAIALVLCLVLAAYGVLDGDVLQLEYRTEMACVMAITLGVLLAAVTVPRLPRVGWVVSAVLAGLSFAVLWLRPGKGAATLEWLLSVGDLPLLVAAIVATAGVAGALVVFATGGLLSRRGQGRRAL
jgi:hypothetical protein